MGRCSTVEDHHHGKAKGEARGKAKGGGGGGNGFLAIAAIVIAIIAVRRQLRLPKEDRTWHGTVDVPVPYDFRRPTVDRLKRSFWAPDDDRLFPGQAFGVGWSLNVARLLGRHSPSE